MRIKLIDLLREDENTQDAEENKIKDLLKMDYPVFVKELGKNINDPKFVAAIKSLSVDYPINFMTVNPIVGKLTPTQNEIDVNKSLKFPLSNVESAEICLKGGVIAVAGKRIITSGGGKYIIDGHHRWSQVCALNPDAKIAAIDLTDIKEPFNALKATQLGIAADLGKVPVAEVEGTNLLTIGKDQLISYVEKNIIPEVISVFKKYNKGNDTKSVGEFIWTNVEKMQKYNQPVAKAPKRGIMPQTDDATKWQDLAPNTDTVKESKRLKKLAGI
jgi:hypothetical protein